MWQPTIDDISSPTIDIDTAQHTALVLLDRDADDASGRQAFEPPPAQPWPEGVATYPVDP